MFSKVLLTTLVSISCASIGAAQTNTTKISKKKNRTVAATASEPAPSYSPAVSMKAPAPEAAGDKNASVSQFAFQPQEGHVAFTAAPSFQTVSMQRNYKPSQQESTTDTRLSLLNVRAQRGFASNWSGSVELAVGSREISPENGNTANDQGLSDIVFGAQRLQETSIGQFFYGGKVALSPGDREEGYSFKNGKSGDGNMFSGGTTLSPFAGLQVDRHEYIIGGQAQFDYAFDRASSTRNSAGDKIDISYNNPHVLKLEAFFEKPNAQFIFGARAGLDHYLESDIQLSSGGQKEVAGTDAYDVMNAGVYARFKANSTIDLLPSLTFSRLIGTNGGTYAVEKADGLNLGMFVRASL